MKVTIGSKIFKAELFDCPSAEQLKLMLPLRLSMIELNGNEKYADLPSNLSMRTINPGKIRSGDIMLYGSRTLVLFYQSFRTEYGYTPLGRIVDVTGLAEALGSEDVEIAFET